MHFVEYLPLLQSKHLAIAFWSHDIKQTNEASCASSMSRAQLYVGIPCQVKLGERKMESDSSFLMLQCSAKPNRSGGELVWKKQMIPVIHYHWRTKDQQKNEEDFNHEGIQSSYAVHRVAAAWKYIASLLTFSKFPRTR